MRVDGQQPINEIKTTFERLWTASRAEPYPDYPTRLDRLTRLASALRDNRERIADALDLDFGGRARHETQLAEILTSLTEISTVRRSLKRWMRPERGSVGPAFWPGKAEIRRQPLGVVGVIAPWNYPVYLAVSPLIDALAAGNRVMLKLSELTPRTADLLIEILAATFRPDEVGAVTGDATMGDAFAGLPFDHLIFTGSTAVGKSVMRRAADHLTPVTLELGGKSPALIAPDFPLSDAVPRIIYGKAFNAGQTCIAPDYVLLPEGLADEFVDRSRVAYRHYFPDATTSSDYTSVVSDRHRDRIDAAIAEARASGAQTIPLADMPGTVASRRPLTLVINPLPESVIMREEIFGPILPVLTYRDHESAIGLILARPRPLATYLFDRDEARIDRCLNQIVAGSFVINDVMWHIAQPELPFGGVGESGMGAYHGRWGFETFSKPTAIYRASRFNIAGLLRPPFSPSMRSFIDFLIRHS